MESNHHSTRRQGYSLLSSPVLSVRMRVAGRARTDAAGLTTPSAAATPRPPWSGDDRARTGGLSPDKRALCSSELRPRRELEGGIGSPQPETETLPSYRLRSQTVAHRHSCQRMSAPPPPHRLAPEACRSQLHVTARALHQPLFRHFLGRPVDRPFLSSAGGIRTHVLELMRLARTAPPLPRSLAGRNRTCGLRRPKPAGWPTPPQPVVVPEHPRRDSNPQLPG